MATWCPACVEHIPQMRLLVSTLGEEGVTFVGVPVDESDDKPKLEAFMSKRNPPYELLADLPGKQRRSVTKFLQDIWPIVGEIPAHQYGQVLTSKIFSKGNST